MRTIIFLIIISGVFILVSDGLAMDAYVTDSFRISLRRGPSIENKILKFLPSGQPVKILETQEGWSRIQLPEDNEGVLTGWVLRRYLITRLPWEDQAELLRKENTQISEELTSLKKLLEETLLREKELSQGLEVNKTALAESQEMYNTLRAESGDYLKLKTEHKKNQEELMFLVEENNSLKSSQTLKFFAMGALVLLCGLMIGLLVGKREKRHRSYY